MAKTDGVARIIALAALGKNGGGSTGGTTNYLELANKPKINNVELTGNKTLEDLGINIPDLENYYTKDMVNEALNKKQNTLTAGNNIVISEDNVISADSGGEIKFYSIYLDTTLNQNASLYLHNISSPYNTELKEFISNVMTECANKNYNSILILIRFKCINSIQQIPYLLLAFDSTYKISSANNNYHVVSIGNEVLQNRIFYKYRIDINGTWSNNVFSVSTIIGSRDKHEFISTETGLTKTNTTSFTPTGDYNPATKKYVDDNVKTYTAGENITISEDNVISANVSGGTDSNAVYTYYAPYSDDDWFTEGNVANILQTVKDKGYSNFELCTLNGTHYALRKGGDLQALTTTHEYYELEDLRNDLNCYTWYTFSAVLDENGKIVVGALSKNSLTAEQLAQSLLKFSLSNFPGYDQSVSHLMLQSNNGVIEWDSSLDGGIFGDSYTDPTYYTEKQVDKIVTDTVNEALGGKY